MLEHRSFEIMVSGLKHGGFAAVLRQHGIAIVVHPLGNITAPTLDHRD
jgi:hypothetical protein